MSPLLSRRKHRSSRYRIYRRPALVEVLEERRMLTTNAFEQEAVYLINRARIQQGDPPLAIYGQLANSSGTKANDLRNCFAHTCNGIDQNDLARDAGYPANIAEVLFKRFPPGQANGQADDAVDFWLNESPSHRDILLGDKQEIGIGRAVSSNTVYWAGHLGTRNPDSVFLTGVIFKDANGNNRYDYQEGLSDVTIAVGDQSTKTNSAGGWAIAVAPNEPHSIAVSGGGYGGQTNGTVRVHDQSRAVDFDACNPESFYVDLVRKTGEHTGETASCDSTNGGDAGSGNDGGDNGGGNNSGGTGSNETNGGNTSDPPPTARNKGSITGTVFLDVDENGQRGSSERGLAGWIVFVDMNENDRHDPGEPVTQTNSNGHYRFELFRHRYRGYGHHVTLELNEHFDNTTRLTRSVLVQAGVNKSGKDFGVVRETEVNGFVFDDRNGDGQKATEERGLFGWTVFHDANRNGQLDAGEQRDVTNRNGKYFLKSLEPGSSQITVLPTNGFTFSDSSAKSVSVRNGTALADKNFGVSRDGSSTRPPRSALKNTGKVSGFVFNDRNANRTLDENEARLTSWLIFVDSNRNSRFDAGEKSVRTNLDGKYELTLPVGVHHIGLELRNESFSLSTNQIRSVQIESNADKSDKNFSVLRDNSISGRVILTDDLVSKGSVVEGWTVFVDLDEDGRLDTNEPAVETDRRGNYRFNSLQPGTYKIVLKSRAGYRVSDNRIRSVRILDGLHRDVNFFVDLLADDVWP